MKKVEQERRHSARIVRRLMAKFYVEGEKPEHGIIRNFSEIGMFIQTRKPLKVGTEITIPLDLESKRQVYLQGVVAWNRKAAQVTVGEQLGGMGVSLLAAPDEYLQFVGKIRGYLTAAPRGVEERYEVYHTVQMNVDGSVIEGHTENLSRGGMFLAINRPLKPPQEVSFDLEIPGIDETVALQGRVVYFLDTERAQKAGRSSGVGIQFFDLPEKSKNTLYHYIRRLETHRTNPERRFIGKIPLSGTLGEFLVPELLIDIQEREESGVLEIERRGIKKKIYLRDGRAVYVESNLRSDALGPFLLRQGVLKSSDLESSLLELTESDLALGEILVLRKLIDPQNLSTDLVTQHEEKVINTFPWFEGSFRFHKDAEWPQAVSILPLRRFHMLFRGIERWYDDKLIATWMGINEHHAIKRVQMPPAEASAPPLVFRVLQRISKPQTILQLSKELDKTPAELLSTAFALILSGWAVLAFPERDTASVVTKEDKTVDELDSSVSDRVRVKIEDDYVKLRNLNFYEIFRIPPQFTDAELTKAFLACSARYTAVDLTKLGDSELRDKAAQIHGWIRLAYETLKDPKLRQHYARRGVKKSKVKRNAEEIEAERHLLRAIQFLEKDDLEKAAKELDLGRKLYPSDPTISGYVGWVLFRKDPKQNLGTAMEYVKDALEKDASDPQLNFFLAEIHAYLGNWSRAERLYGQALRLQPDFVKAAARFEKARDERIALERISKKD